MVNVPQLSRTPLATIGMLPPTPASARRRDRPAVDRLVEADQPSIRFLTLTQLLHQSPSASEALRARRQIPTSGWVRDLLAEQNDRTYWFIQSHVIIQSIPELSGSSNYSPFS